MGFKDEYTIQALIDAEKAAMLLDKSIIPVEQSKILVSNDAYAIGGMLEILENKLEILRLK